MLLGISGGYYPILDCLFQWESCLPIAFWELKLFSAAYVAKQLLILSIGLVWAVFFLHNSQIIRHLSPKNRQASGLEDCGWKKSNNWIDYVLIFQLVRFSPLWTHSCSVVIREGAEEGGWVNKCRHVSTLFFKEREGWHLQLLASVEPSRSNHRAFLLFLPLCFLWLS